MVNIFKKNIQLHVSQLENMTGTSVRRDTIVAAAVQVAAV